MKAIKVEHGCVVYQLTEPAVIGRNQQPSGFSWLLDYQW